MRSASASAASTRAADFLPSIGQSTRSGGVIAADSPAGGTTDATDFVVGAGAGARESMAGAADVFGSSIGSRSSVMGSLTNSSSGRRSGFVVSRSSEYRMNACDSSTQRMIAARRSHMR
jgi:hypothetical protein